MFRKVVQADCMKRRVVKYYSTSSMTKDMVLRFEKYGTVEFFPLLKTYKVNVPYKFLIQGILEGYQFSVSHKSEKWQTYEQELDADLQISSQEKNARSVYLDYNATTPIEPRVLEKMMPFFLDMYANPFSSYHSGKKVWQSIEKARKQVANIIEAQPQEIFFTSGGTESINLALSGLAHYQKHNTKRHKIITIQTEHSATINTCKMLEKRGFEVIYLPVDIGGNICLQSLSNAIDNECFLVSVMHANNETGVIHQIKKIGDIIKKSSALFHVDAIQSIGKLPISVVDYSIDLLSLSAHKIYGPKGSGALYIKEECKILPLLYGGNQEAMLRAGTQNVAGIVGLGEACQIAWQQLEKNSCHLYTLRKHFLQLLAEKKIPHHINGNTQQSLPSTLNISFSIDSDTLLLMLDEKGIAVSRGSACHASAQEISPVLLSMGIEEQKARGALRFSFGKYTSLEEIEFCVTMIDNILQSLDTEVTS